jgi:K+-sensing histidine kinase KdpD
VNLSSFELRAPITAMKGYADLLLSGDSGKLSKDAESKVQTILDSADKLLRIIEDMAQIQTLSEARSTSTHEQLRASAVAESCVDSLKKVVAESGRRFEFQAIKSDSEVTVTKADIGRLLGMVANTAARTAEPKSVVTMRIEENDQEIDFRIENQGSPLERDQQKNVFDYVGAQGFEEGIGYYVAQQILSAHQARFSVSQTKSGNAFVLSIPRTASKKPAKQPAGKKVDITK